MIGEVKLCQSCIERGVNPPNPATREWQPNIFYCEECYVPLLNNLTNIAPASIEQIKDKVNPGVILPQIYKLLNVPPELQYDNVDTTCRHYDKIFNFHAPAVVNRELESLQQEVEQLGMALFHIKYKMEPLEMQIKKLKELRRAEKNLKSYDDSKEEYSKKKPSTVKATQEEKMAKTLGLTLDAYRELQKKAREREFNKMAGNCPECGAAMPCLTHAKK